MRGGAGRAYFVFDDAGVVLRDWIGDLLSARGVSVTPKSISYRTAWFVSSALEFAWRLLRRPGSPPIVRALVRLQGKEFRVSDARARVELGYTPPVTRAGGLAEIAAAAARRFEPVG